MLTTLRKFAALFPARDRRDFVRSVQRFIVISVANQFVWAASAVPTRSVAAVAIAMPRQAMRGLLPGLLMRFREANRDNIRESQVYSH